MANANTLTLAAESGEWSLPSRRKVGVIGLILTESALFTIFVVAYLFYIGKSATGPYPKDVLELPILATICLLSSSLTVVLAERAFRRGNTGGFQTLVVDHDSPRGGVLGLHRYRMAEIDL